MFWHTIAFISVLLLNMNLSRDSNIKFCQSATNIDAYDFVEISINIDKPNVNNPFTDVVVDGEFKGEDEKAIHVDGFCDSQDGSIYKIRFMPTKPGKYTYFVKYRQGNDEITHNGSFIAKDGKKRGIVRVDPEHPWHFIWEGTGEHYFWNGTTTYWIVGWNDDDIIYKSLDRLARLKVNRIRATLSGRVKDGQASFENVYPNEKFTFLLNPWIPKNPDSVEKPEFDLKRFNVSHWQRYERMLKYARDKGIIVSVIFYLDGARPGCYPFGKELAGGEDEQRYYRYAIARFSAFSNVMWDVSNEYQNFRDVAWANKMGTFLKECDPYKHLTSVHGHENFMFRTAPWADFAMYQSWDEGGSYDFMLRHRENQIKTGRIIPQINEEYGYEDHYPRAWGGGRVAPARSGDNRRRLAWGMYMAGGYQTTGEKAVTDKGWTDNAGGGWINGRGDDSMTMLIGYGHIVDFFTSFDWWELEPNYDFVEIGQAIKLQERLTHIVYTRDKDGNAVLYLNGVKQSSRQIAGDLSNWNDNFQLLFANELTLDRPWLGELHKTAIYDRAFNENEVIQNFQKGIKNTSSNPCVLYTFTEGNGNVIRDVSSKDSTLDMSIDDEKAVRWLPNGGLEIISPTLISSKQPATKINKAIKDTNAITLEAWIKPANLNQSGPARIVSISQDTGRRNITLGQINSAVDVRFRTTSTSENGEPSLRTLGDKISDYIYASRSPKGDLAVIYFPSGKEIRIKSDVLKSGLKAKWYNPRDGQWSDAKPLQNNTFIAPDQDDWVLLLRK